MKTGSFAAKAAKAHLSHKTFMERVLTHPDRFDAETVEQARARRSLLNWGARKSNTLV